MIAVPRTTGSILGVFGGEIALILVTDSHRSRCWLGKITLSRVTSDPVINRHICDCSLS
jgi:hypothetical protein